jgi:hypothetical protein
MRRFAATALALLLVLAFFSSEPAEAGELRVHYGAIKKLLEAKFFDAEGAHYLQGSADTPCNFSRLEQPAVSARGGRLVIAMQFASKVGASVRDRCMGPGDNFGVELSGVPVYSDGVIRLAEVAFDSDKAGVGALIGPFVTAQLTEALQFPLQERIEEAAQALWADSGLGLRVPVMLVPAIVLGPQQLKVSFDFEVELH